jgi:hypothetical protein
MWRIRVFGMAFLAAEGDERMVQKHPFFLGKALF